MKFFSYIFGILIKKIFFITLLTKEAIDLSNLNYFENEKQIYDDKEEFEKMKEYNMHKYILNTVVLIFSCYKLAFFIGFNYLHKMYKKMKLVYKTKNEMIKESLCASTVVCANVLIDLPFQIYNLIFLLKKYGFYKIGVIEFIFSKLLSVFFYFLLTFSFCMYFLFLYKKCGKYLWIPVFFSLVICILMLKAYGHLSITAGYELEPLKNEDYSTEIHDLADKVGYESKNIYKLNISKHTTLPNAFCSGFGSLSKIVIFDTIYNILTKDQILSVVCHELGHWYHGHLENFNVWTLIFLGLIAYCFCHTLKKSESSTNYPIMLVFFYTFCHFKSIYDIFFLIINNKHSWQNELEADKYANEMGYGKDLIDALKIMDKVCLSNVYGSYLFNKYTSTHPPLFTRISHLGDSKKDKAN
ncbi:hypothetical protein BDAP_001876 [Binucleata daphniae]